MWHNDLQPMEWLQYIADSFSGLADLWDEYDSNYFEEEFEDYKAECPDISKIEMYSEVSHGVGERLLHWILAERLTNSIGEVLDYEV